MAGANPKQTIDDGLGFVPEDRKHDGFVGTFTVAENLVLNHFDEPPYARGMALDLKAIRSNAEHRVRSSISAPSPSTAPSPRCPAEISRRWCWPASCPGPFRC